MGILYSIGAAIFFALSVISVRRGVSQLGVFTGTVIMLSGGAVFLVCCLYHKLREAANYKAQNPREAERGETFFPLFCIMGHAHPETTVKRENIRAYPELRLGEI